MVPSTVECADEVASETGRRFPSEDMVESPRAVRVLEASVKEDSSYGFGNSAETRNFCSELSISLLATLPALARPGGGGTAPNCAKG